MTKKEGSICSHQPDADEPSDQVELVGFAPVKDVVTVEITECPGILCPNSSEVCDVCGLYKDGKGDEDGADDDSAPPDEVRGGLPEKVDPAYMAKNHLVGRKGSLEDLYSVASNIQGARAAVEGRRMKNFCV